MTAPPAARGRYRAAHDLNNGCPAHNAAGGWLLGDAARAGRCSVRWICGSSAPRALQRAGSGLPRLQRARSCFFCDVVDHNGSSSCRHYHGADMSCRRSASPALQ